MPALTIGSCWPIPVCFPLAPINEAPLLKRLAHTRAVTHLVTMSRNPGGITSGRTDQRGGVRALRSGITTSAPGRSSPGSSAR